MIERQKKTFKDTKREDVLICALLQESSELTNTIKPKLEDNVRCANKSRIRGKKQ